MFCFFAESMFFLSIFPSILTSVKKVTTFCHIYVTFEIFFFLGLFCAWTAVIPLCVYIYLPAGHFCLLPRCVLQPSQIEWLQNEARRIQQHLVPVTPPHVSPVISWLPECVCLVCCHSEVMSAHVEVFIFIFWHLACFSVGWAHFVTWCLIFGSLRCKYLFLLVYYPEKLMCFLLYSSET